MKSRTKHIDIRLKFCWEVITANKLKIKYVRTADNLADIFTNRLQALLIPPGQNFSKTDHFKHTRWKKW